MKEPSPGLFPSKQDLPQLFFILAIASVIAIACNYSVNFLHRPLKPFCSDGIPSSSISDFCEPCPKNGRCYSNHWECIHGFKKRGKACVEDSEIYLRAKDLSDNIDQHVCKGHAQVLCGGIGQSWFQEAELLKEFGENKLKDNNKFHGDIYNFSAQKAVETLRNSLEMRKMKDGIVELKCSDRLVEKYKPLVCCFRQWIYEHLFLMLAVTLGVEEFRQEDSRVDQYPKLVKGEQKVVWEWQVEGSLSSKVKPKREADAKKLSEKGHDSRVPRQKLQIRQLM